MMLMLLYVRPTISLKDSFFFVEIGMNQVLKYDLLNVQAIRKAHSLRHK